MKDIIVFDLDGTLRDGAHRLHLVPKENLDRTESWNEFNLACGDDTPIMDNLALPVPELLYSHPDELF